MKTTDMILCQMISLRELMDICVDHDRQRTRAPVYEGASVFAHVLRERKISRDNRDELCSEYFEKLEDQRGELEEVIENVE